MKKILISVIMSVYKERINYLEKAIKSILNQTYSNFEFIICVDGEKNNKKQLKLIKEFKKKDERIKIIYNKKNKGLTKSLNKLITKSKGKYLARMDSDDIALPQRLEKQINFMEKNKQISLVGCKIKFIDKNGKLKKHFRPKIFLRNNKIKIIHPIFNQFIHSCFFIRKKNLTEKKVKYNEQFKYSQDYEFSLNLISKGMKTANLKEKLMLYRINDQSISFKKRKEQLKFANKSRKKYLKQLPQGKIGIFLSKLMRK